jgi:hypothetical protein
MLFSILNGFYLIIWSILLVDCLIQRRFYPIIGRGLATKIFWLLTFIPFNPLLSLLYFIFAVLTRLLKSQESGRHLYLGSVFTAISVILVTVFFELPLGDDKIVPVTLSGFDGNKTKAHEIFLPAFGAHLGTIKAKNDIQTYSSTSTGSDLKVSIRNVLLTCRNSCRLLDRVARELQKSLARLPYVDTVIYYPEGTTPQQAVVLPDVFIILDMSRVDEKNLFRIRKLDALIECKAGSTVFADVSHTTFTDDMGPVVQFNIESQLHHISNMLGIESPQARYKLEAANIAGVLMESIGRQFENLIEKYSEIPKLPDIVYGTYTEPPALPFLSGNNVETLVSGSGLLKDNSTVWNFVEKQQTDEAMTSYCDQLQKLGWIVRARGNGYLQMDKANQHIDIFRQSKRNVLNGSIVSSEPGKAAFGELMIAYYQACFSNERLQMVMDELLKSGAALKTLLLFNTYFRTPEQRESLHTIIELSAVHTLEGYLVLAQYWIDHNDIDKARKAIVLARAMQCAEKGSNIKEQQIKSLAEKVGDINLAQAGVDEQPLREIGFINIKEVVEPLKFVKPLEEPVLLYQRGEDGNIVTLTVRIIRSREPSSSEKYQLLTIIKQGGIASSSVTSGTLQPNAVWITETRLDDFSNENRSIDLRVEGMADEQFLFTITSK